MKFYDEMPEMEFFSGDTLPFFTVEVDGENVSDCIMTILISKVNSPETVLIRKNCDKIDGGFSVRLTTQETSQLKEGAYIIRFQMTDSDGLKYIKLSGRAYVHAN